MKSTVSTRREWERRLNVRKLVDLHCYPSFVAVYIWWNYRQRWSLWEHQIHRTSGKSSMGPCVTTSVLARWLSPTNNQPIDRPTDWASGRMTDGHTDRLASWMGWLTDHGRTNRRTGSFTDQLTSRHIELQTPLTGWTSKWWAYWQTNRLAGCLRDLLNDCETDGLTDRPTNWGAGWVADELVSLLIDRLVGLLIWRTTAVRMKQFLDISCAFKIVF